MTPSGVVWAVPDGIDVAAPAAQTFQTRRDGTAIFILSVTSLLLIRWCSSPRAIVPPHADEGLHGINAPEKGDKVHERRFLYFRKPTYILEFLGDSTPDAEHFCVLLDAFAVNTAL
jgi:hypothetical protein